MLLTVMDGAEMKDNITVIGTGVIGGAIINSLLKNGYEGKVTAAEIDPEKAKVIEKLGVSVTRDNREAAKKADIIFVSVKPNVLKTVLTEISKEIEGKLVEFSSIKKRITGSKK